jgi:hypothetical protein
MNVVPSDTAPPHFFLVGLRAPPGVPFDAANPNAQKVGTFVARSRRGFDGSAMDAGEVLTEDVPFDLLPPEGPFRLESEIAPWKSAPDVVVVDRLQTFLTPAQLLDLGPPAVPDAIAGHIEGAVFGSVAIDRGTGFGPPIAQGFGWRPRGVAPRVTFAGRAGPAGDPAALASFDPEQFELPDDFENAFHSGRPVAGQAYFRPGHKLRFSDNAGPVTIVTVPDAPVLAVTKDGQPLQPALVLEPVVDTVVMDREAGNVTFTWRATFLWEPRFENTTLEVG